jgi:hydroxymethylpyrimidine pyrophosphatase-like HAD family hydrolase
MILAIDFDGTLCKDAYPKIGEPNENLIAHLIMFKNKGHKLILWTCREEKDLWEAVQWCESLMQ